LERNSHIKHVVSFRSASGNNGTNDDEDDEEDETSDLIKKLNNKGVEWVKAYKDFHI
jgi:hypothetical protein